MMRALIRSVVAGLKRGLPLAVRLHVLAAVVPKRLWFRTVVGLSRMQTSMLRAGSQGSAGWARAMALDWWLYELTWRGEFPVECRVVGLEVLREAARHGGGTLICGTHIPYMRTVLRVAVDHEIAISFAVAGGQQITAEGRWLPTGWPQGLPTIEQGPDALLRMRRSLRRGEVGAMMMDREVGGPFYPNGMRLAGRVGARVVLTWAEMADDGALTVTFSEAPHPVPDTEEKVMENLAVLEAQRARILGALQYVAQSRRDSEQEQGVETKAEGLGEAL